MLTVQQILAWADAHHARTGTWPKIKSVPPDLVEEIRKILAEHRAKAK